MKKRLVIIAGPTASGKTDMAVKIAQHLDTEIVSADSRQIFKEMRIGTAVPDAETLRKVKHHLIQTHSVTEYYNVYKYEQEVIDILDNDIFQRKDVAVMCGGSMLYVDAVCNGIDYAPDRDENIRAALWQRFDAEGIEPLKEQLKILDPQYYNECDLHNHTRIIKALEVCLQTGKPYSSFRTGIKKERNFEIVKIGLNYPREILHDRINRRVDIMMGEGLLDEVRGLAQYRNLMPLNTVGYKELFDYLDEKTDLTTAVELIKRNTRRYAKKQITWFNKSLDNQWFNPSTDESKIIDAACNGIL
ncbi:MAG: tRNA (adenosine(37)-N6)-dimethylallyltransferase MiaA [Bacteroidales bacterium]|nr:tRNA (adenosine(37)-N6)-dimethylallyltransferase MiaA [Bacteroidales bacterium]